MRRVVLAGLILALCWLPALLRAEERLAPAEVSELVIQIEAILSVDGDYLRSEGLAQDLYGLVLQDIGAETRSAIEVERLIVASAVARSQGERAGALARQMMEKANRLLPADDPLGYRCAAIAGSAMRILGESEAGLGFVSQALAQADQHLPPGDLALIDLLMVQAILASDAGQPEVAEAAYVRLDTLLAPRTDEAGKSLRVVALQGYGRHLAAHGDAGRAAAVLARVIEAMDAQFAALPRPRMMPLRLSAVAELGELLILLDRKPEALALVTPLMDEVAAHYGTDSIFWADLAFVRAVALTDSIEGGPDDVEALQIMEQVVTVMAATLEPGTRDLQRARINLAVLLVSAGRGERALDELAELGDQTAAGERSQVVYILYSLLSRGIITQDRAVDAALRWMQDSQSSGAAAAQRLLTARLQAGSDEGAALLRARSDLKGRLSAARAEFAALSSQPLETRDPQAVTAYRQAIADLDAELLDLNRRLASEHPRLAGVTVPSALSLTEIRRRLGPDEALVVIDPPRHDGDAGLVVAVSATAVDWHTFQADRATVDDAVMRLRQGINLRLGLRAAAPLDDEPAPETAQGFDLDAAYWLYAQTFGQLEPVLTGKTHLLVDLRGGLSALPPQLLLTAPPRPGDLAAQDWLVRRHAVTILPAIAALPEPGTAPAAPPDSLLAFADPVFAGLAAGAPTALRGALAPLPETADEVADVARALGAPPDALRLGSGATEAALKSADLAGVGTLYFATHGLVSGDQVGEGMALAEPALALTPGGGEDGFLTASEIAELRLGAGLVVLSACNTAVGAAPGAESLSGLAQSFLYAGARGLMVSHWPVESRSAVVLMTDLFDRHAATPGRPLAFAQQAAMLEMIDRPRDARWPHPAYWAPFVVVGNPG